MTASLLYKSHASRQEITLGKKGEHMTNRTLTVLCTLAFCALLAVSCNFHVGPSKPGLNETPENDSKIPNPAAVNCQKNGYKLEIRTAADGSQSGVCIFPDGSECDEWAYFRGECGPDSLNPNTENKAVEAVKILLAKQFNVEISQIAIFSLKQVNWPDRCLGLPEPGEVCKTVETPGFRVTLTVGENNYTYRTDLTGENIRLEAAGVRGEEIERSPLCL